MISHSFHVSINNMASKFLKDHLDEVRRQCQFLSQTMHDLYTLSSQEHNQSPPYQLLQQLTSRMYNPFMPTLQLL